MNAKYLIIASGNGMFQTEIMEFDESMDLDWKDEFEDFDDYVEECVQERISEFEQGMMSAVAIKEGEIEILKEKLKQL